MFSKDEVYRVANEIAKDYDKLDDKYREKLGERIAYLKKLDRKKAVDYWMLLSWKEDIDDILDEYKKLNKKNRKKVYSLISQTADYVVSESPITEKETEKETNYIFDKYNAFMDTMMQYEVLFGDYETVIRKSANGFNISRDVSEFPGLVHKSAGIKRDVSNVVRSLVLWAIKGTNLKLSEKAVEKGWANGYEIDYHENPRPSHAYMGGKQFVCGEDRVINGRYFESFERVAEPRLNDPNCLHFKWAIICGVTPPKHSDEELDLLNAKDAQKVKFEGTEYTKYDASQVQRRYENEVRKSKKTITLAKKAGEKAIVEREKAKIKRIKAKYDKISDAFDLKKRM